MIRLFRNHDANLSVGPGINSEIAHTNAPGITPGDVTGLSYGGKAVGLSFNPGSNRDVDNVKRLSAMLIDAINDWKEKGANGEQIAQATLAIRRIQEGQMWAVKAITWQY